MKLFVVLLQDRKFAEFIESDVYQIFIPVVHDVAVYLPHVKSKLINLSKEYEYNIPDDEIEVYPISDFMDMVNCDDINLSNYFITYVYVM
jgi:hypothetical protein